MVLTVLPQSVGGQVSVNESGVVHDRAKQLLGGTTTVAKPGTTILVGAPEFEATGPPAGVVPASASGIARVGTPYISINLAYGVLAPDQSSTFTVPFKNPKRWSFAYGILTFDEDASS